MPGTPEGGRKSAAKVKEIYGENAAKEWGKIGNQSRKHKVAQFKADPAIASRAGAKGGSLGHRCRTITPNDPLKNDEWAFLLKYINRAAGKIRLEGGMDAMGQHDVYHKVFQYMESGDWVGAVKESCTHPNFQHALSSVITEEWEYYNEKVKGQPRRSFDREQLRVIRNVKAAYQSLGVEDGKTSNNNPTEL